MDRLLVTQDRCPAVPIDKGRRNHTRNPSTSWSDKARYFSVSSFCTGTETQIEDGCLHRAKRLSTNFCKIICRAQVLLVSEINGWFVSSGNRRYFATRMSQPRPKKKVASTHSLEPCPEGLVTQVVQIISLEGHGWRGLVKLKWKENTRMLPKVSCILGFSGPLPWAIQSASYCVH